MAALTPCLNATLTSTLRRSPQLAEVRAASALPLGIQERSGGVNFSLFSRNANGVRLELFDQAAKRQ